MNAYESVHLIGIRATRFLVLNPSVPAKSIAELVTRLKNQPDTLNFSSGAFGTLAHLIGVRLHSNKKAGEDRHDRALVHRRS